MEIEIDWSDPIELQDGSKELLIYKCPSLGDVPDAPGIYVFARRHGESISPLYIGQAQSVRRRIEQQLNNTRLMKGIEAAESGARVLLIAQLLLKGGQTADRVLDVAESAVVEYTLAQGHSLLNKQGTKQPVHTIHSRGNIWSRQIVPVTLQIRQRDT